jgi:hypothetical protein
MASLNRIVLLDRGGDELFSGQSMLSTPPPIPDDPPVSSEPETLPRSPALGGDVDDEHDEPCPETLRSSVFVRVREASFVARSEIVEVTIANDHRAA